MRKLLITWLLVLAGCSTQDLSQPQQYLLPDLYQDKVAPQGAPLLLVEVELASYLDVSGIVYQSSMTQVVQAKQNVWATDIAQQLESKVIEILAANQSSYWPVVLNSALDLSESHKLLVQVDKFNGSFSGNALVEGNWMLVDQHGTIVKGGSFKQHIALDQEGYQALVIALNSGLDAAIKRISQSL